MPVQSSTDYSAEHDAAFEGQKVNLGLTNITSKVAEATDINFGRAVVRGTADNQALLPSGPDDKFIGITELTTAWSQNANDIHLYERYREMNIIDFGMIWVYTESAVSPGDPVYYRHTADTAPLDIVGRFRNDSSGGDATMVDGATFESTATAGTLAKVKLVGVETSAVVTVVATSGALPLTADTIIFDTTAGASTSTLADGVEGQTINLIMTVDGGDQVLTPANLTAGTTITFADVGDSVTLRFTAASWVVVSNVGALIA